MSPSVSPNSSPPRPPEGALAGAVSVTESEAGAPPPRPGRPAPRRSPFSVPHGALCPAVALSLGLRTGAPHGASTPSDESSGPPASAVASHPRRHLTLFPGPGPRHASRA